jgi:hypothetical protein
MYDTHDIHQVIYDTIINNEVLFQLILVQKCFDILCRPQCSDNGMHISQLVFVIIYLQNVDSRTTHMGFPQQS